MSQRAMAFVVLAGLAAGLAGAVLAAPDAVAGSLCMLAAPDGRIAPGTFWNGSGSAPWPQHVGIAAATPDPEGWLRLPVGLPDYAPAGLPDFDQRQSRWRIELMGRTHWTHDGPVALANALWWIDSRHEQGAAPPPARSDSVPLIRAFGDWDDHAPENVRHLVADLAFRANTNERSDFVSSGTCLSDLAGAADGLLTALGDSQSLTARVVDMPTLDRMASDIGREHATVLLLGFWQHHPAADWQRIGGHYVTLEAVDRAMGRIRIADPFRDRGPPAESAGAHNDAGLVSHDAWLVSPSLRDGAPLWLEGYLGQDGEAEALLANFQATNGRRCPDAHAPWLDGARLEAQIEAAMVLMPAGIDETPAGPTVPARTETPGTTATAGPTTSGPGPATGTPSSTAGASATPTPTAPRDGPTVEPVPATSGPITPSTTPGPPTTAPAAPTTAPGATDAPPEAPTVAPTSETPAGTAGPTETPDVGHVCVRVTNASDGAPLAAAVLWLLLDGESIAFARTDVDGSHCFRELPVGRYGLRVEARACATSERPVTLAGGMVHLDIALSCHPIHVLLPMALSSGARQARR